MARKTLLTEAELRSFMKLAELTPLGADKIAEIYGAEEDLEEGEDKEPVRKGKKEQDDDPPGKKAVQPVREADDDDDDDPPGMYGKRSMEEEMGMDIEMDKDADDADDAAGDMDMKMDMDMDAPAAGGDSKMVSIDDFMGALEDALEQVLGDDVEVEMDDEEDAMDAMDGMDSDDDAGMDDDPAGMGDRPMMEEEDIVNEVARRVAARLQDKKNKAEMVDQLAERILNRLTSK